MMANKNLILVEGTDDLHVVAHLLKFYGYEGKIHIEKREGIDKLLKSLPHVLTRKFLERLAIISLYLYVACMAERAGQTLRISDYLSLSRWQFRTRPKVNGFFERVV